VFFDLENHEEGTSKNNFLPQINLHDPQESVFQNKHSLEVILYESSGEEIIELTTLFNLALKIFAS
jgi:hypothetical protein